jgi:hypothetical protein
MSYLIVSSIQMGANIDYDIDISGRFMELKDKMSKKEAIIETMNFAFPTIITSGSMLAIAGILIGQMTSDAAIAGIGQCLGRGTLLSIFIVMFILPEILLLGEKVIDKTSFTVSMPLSASRSSGLVRINGRVRGQINGIIIGEVHGIVRGEVNAIMEMGSLEQVEETAEYLSALEMAELREEKEKNSIQDNEAAPEQEQVSPPDEKAGGQVPSNEAVAGEEDGQDA